MRILWIEDEPEDALTPSIRQVLVALRGMIEVKVVTDYSVLGKTKAKILQYVKSYSLLVLDVLQGDSNDGFVTVVNAIAYQKPFLAYTIKMPSIDLRIAGNDIELRQWVFSRGGLGVIHKSTKKTRSPDEPSQSDTLYELISRIVQFYWMRRM